MMAANRLLPAGLPSRELLEVAVFFLVWIGTALHAAVHLGRRGASSPPWLGHCRAVAGLAAENMVRGGGRLFLDLGRRVERARAIANELACVLDEPAAQARPTRLEPGLRLALELRDSVITYRARYLSVMQAGAVLDLVMADEGNPRGLAYQLAATRDLLAELGGLAARGIRHFRLWPHAVDMDAVAGLFRAVLDGALDPAAEVPARVRAGAGAGRQWTGPDQPRLGPMAPGIPPGTQ
jgi:hypothetical protein